MSRVVFGCDPATSGAALSTDGRYRYRLWRIWQPVKPHLVWVLLNPSTADAATDDPTLRRCIGFARDWDYGGVVIVNLFGLRATNPRELLTYTDPVGPENDTHVANALRHPNAGPVICGWGCSPILTHPGNAGRERKVLDTLRDGGRTIWCLGQTKDGHPRHPLYIAASTPLERLPCSSTS